MATETEIEAVAKALHDDVNEHPWSLIYPSAREPYLRTAETAIAALDRVRADDARDGWVKLDDVVHWLRHIDRLDEIPGAKAGMPRFNPLWDAANALEAGFSGGAEDTRPQDEDHEAVAQAHRAAAYGGTWMRLPDDEYDAIGRAYLCAERDRVAELEAVIAIGRCNVCGERLSTESVQDRIDRAVMERTAENEQLRTLVKDALHALAYGHTDAAMERLGKAVREFPAPTRTQEASE